MSRRVSPSVVLIVVLAVVTLAVTVLALRPKDPPEAPPLPKAAASASATTPAQPTASATVDPSLVVKAVEPPLVLTSATDAFRATSGTCLGGGAVFRTSDGGTTWTKLSVDASAVLTLRADSTSSVQAVVANGTGCDPLVLASTDSGVTWVNQPDDSLWYRLASSPSFVHTPTGVVLNPCSDRNEPVVELEGLTATQGVALCVDGSVLASKNGRSFSTLSSVNDAVALSFDSPDEGWILVRDGQRCPAYALQRTVDGGVSWQTGGCVGAADDLAKEVPPALDFVDPQTGMVTIGVVAYTTADGGVTWNRVVTTQ
ncbi:MAG: hypothetical protein WAN48_15560 [Actinomycetes bacterium]